MDELPGRAGYQLIMVVPVATPVPGLAEVLLMCSCSACTFVVFGADAAGETGRSGRCAGCGTEHWFRVPPPPEEDG